MSIAAQAGAVAAGVIHHLEVHLPAAPPPVRVRLLESMPMTVAAFQPREAVFARLREVLAGGAGRVVMAAVAGGRGVGKTQVAAALCQAGDAEGWPVIVWLPAESTTSIVDGLARLADRVDRRPEGATVEEAAAAGLAWLSAQPGPGVVVFDNAENPDVVAAWSPRSSGIRVLVTTTRRTFAALGAVVDVGVYERPEAIAYLCQRTGLDDPVGAGRVADELGLLPVALAQAGAVIGGVQFPTFDAYLARLHTVDVAQALVRPVGDPYPREFAQAVTLSMDDLGRVDADGRVRRVLDALALLSPDGVPLRFLPAFAGAEGDPAGRSEAGRSEAGRSAAGRNVVYEQVETLLARSLVTLSAARDEVIVHRLLARVLREIRRDDVRPGHDRRPGNDGLGNGGLADLIRRTAGGLETIRPTGGEHQLAYRDVWRRLGPQVTALRANTPATVDAETLRPVQSLTFRLMYHLLEVGEPRQAVEIGPQVVADMTRVLGPDHPDTISSRNNLANGYQDVGRYAEAIALHEQTLADYARILGPDHPDTLTSRNNLANAYATVGHYAEAIRLHEQTLADRTRVLGPTHLDTLTSRNNLAEDYRVVGWYPEAITLFEQTLADRTRVLGPTHPDTLTSRYNLANGYATVGRHAEAVALDEQTLADHTRILGPDHPHTLASRGNLAAGYREVGRYAEAIALDEQTLTDRARVLGAHHPDTLNSREGVALSYYAAGRHPEAVVAWEQALADRTRILGPAHPDTLNSRSNLAAGYREVGRYAEAVALDEQTLADRTRVLGPDHPNTRLSRNNLAESRRRQAATEPGYPR